WSGSSPCATCTRSPATRSEVFLAPGDAALGSECCTRTWKTGPHVAPGTVCALPPSGWRLSVAYWRRSADRGRRVHDQLRPGPAQRPRRAAALRGSDLRVIPSTLRVLATMMSAASLAGCAVLPIAKDRSGTVPTGSPVAVAMLDASHGWNLTTSGVWRTIDGGHTWARVKNLPSINYA